MINKLTGDVTTPQGSGSQPATIAAGVVTYPKMFPGTIREALTATRPYYVRTDGNDANTGLVNSAGGAFLTIQHAMDVVGSIDTVIFDVKIKIGDGTYNEDITFRSIVGSGQVTFEGNLVTPANVIVNSASISFFGNSPSGTYLLRGLTMQGGAACILAQGGACLVDFANVRFGAVSVGHIVPVISGSIQASGSYTIFGAAPRHILANSAGFFQIQTSLTLTITGTPAFSTAFIECTQGSTVIFGSAAVTLSGSATGSRFIVNKVSLIDTSGGALTFLPGNAAGTQTNANGGYYT